MNAGGALGAAAAGAREAGLHGLLSIDKPAGVTSHDVVERVRRRFGTHQVGHLGTLDPAATGLLIVALGAATRCAVVWQGGEKTYQGAIRLGVVTDTQDLTGRVLESHAVTVDEAALREAALGLVGDIEQVPPMVSAIRVGGERLYRLARRGETVERAPRRVRVVAWEWEAIALPDARFRVRCSGGTYVRTLAHDLGQRLGCGGALASLRRLRSEPFGLERALSWRDLNDWAPSESWQQCGIPLAAALSVLPHVTVDASQGGDLGFGRAIGLDAATVSAIPEGAGPRSIVIRAADGTPLALGEIRRTAGGAHEAAPHVVFPWAVREGRG